MEEKSYDMKLKITDTTISISVCDVIKTFSYESTPLPAFLQEVVVAALKSDSRVSAYLADRISKMKTVEMSADVSRNNYCYSEKV